MSSGSYFTIYRKHKNIIMQDSMLASLRNEYIKSSQNSMFASRDKQDSNDVPQLMLKNFKASSCLEDDDSCNEFYDANGVLHERLLTFHFCSDFTALKDKFNLNAYRYDKQSVFVSKNEAEKILQAIDYLLSREYSQKFEDILNNEYVELLGNGYSVFDNRFKNTNEELYIDKLSDDGYSVTFGDTQYNAEVKESDSSIVFNLKRTKSCIQAFLDAESYDWKNEELVLEYSAY